MASRRSTPALASRVFAALLLVTTVAVVAALAMAALLFQQSTEKDVRADIRRECELVASSLGRLGQSERMGVVRDLELGTMRLTLVDPDGTVTFDSEEAATSMGNHRDRPEIALALSAGEGDSERDSQTLGVVSYYHAERLPDGSVVRVSEDAATALSIIAGDTNLLLLVALVVVLLSWAAARLLSRKLVAPILSIDPVAEPNGSPYRELEPLVNRLNEQQATLTEQMDQLRDAEAMRQQFTANVTHELKTPLAAISGAAELIRDGIARPEDVGNFAGRIYDESQRLTSLVNDILTLSKLDESERAGETGIVGSVERCDLLGISTDVASRLSGVAEGAGVRLTATGTPAIVTGNARLLDELVYNLCGNAVRYNRPGGTATVTCGVSDAGEPFVRVADTGIGIPQADHAKVFERFYRVDTSRSRASGGTGLGLAIVKHSAAFHHASIELDSREGEGTTITVTFPAGE
ncbi:ATP-binding protein [Atopobiaceae bacterium LCP21S3_F11]